MKHCILLQYIKNFLLILLPFIKAMKLALGINNDEANKSASFQEDDCKIKM